MKFKIGNIFCVGRNYRLHAEELGNAIPEQPMLFLKPTHALVPMDGRKIRLPKDRGLIHYEAELVLHIGRAYEKGIAVDDLVDQFALGIDFTLRDVQSRLKEQGHPWLAAKGFLNSAFIGPFRENPGVHMLKQKDFTLYQNGKLVQRGNIGEMIFSLQEIVDYCAAHFGLDQGDLIYTGTPAGVGAVHDQDHLLLKWGDDPAGESIIQIE